MRILPYTNIDQVSFGSSEETVVSILGSKFTRKANEIGQVELAYENSTFRFLKVENILVEVTVNSEYFQIDDYCLSAGSEIAFVELGYFVAKFDQDSFEAQGFIVSPKFGIAFDPHFPSWLTVFSKSELGAWQKLA